VSVLSTKQNRRARRSDAIIEATLSALRRHGYAATSLDRIADEAGTSKRMVLHYFGSRERLFDEVVRCVGRRVLDQVERAMSAESDPMAAVSDGLDALWREIVADPGLHAVFFGLLSESMSDSEHRSAIAAVRSEYRALIAGALAAGWDRSPYGDPESVATLVLAGIAGLTIDFLERGHTAAVERAFAEFKLHIAALTGQDRRHSAGLERFAIV
jgi:TetR/AcrR family transcriptional regulator, transcriptional repressor of bet genes